MNIDLGHERWKLVITTPRQGIESGYQDVNLQFGRVFLPDRFGLEELTALEARQTKDSSFVGKIGIEGFKLTEQGFEVTGGRFGEDGDYTEDGPAFQQWKATRKYET